MKKQIKITAYPVGMSKKQWKSLYQMASPELQKQMQLDVEKMKSSKNLGHVIEDDLKFSTSLGFKSTDGLLGSSAFGILSGVAIGVTVAGVLSASAAATSAAALAAAVAGLGFFGKIGLALGIVTLPVVTTTFPIAIPIVAGIGTAVGIGSITYFIKTKGKKFATYGGYRSFNTNIDRLGHSIAGKIFIPIIGLIKGSGKSNYSFVIAEMEKWGYSKNYVNNFIVSINEMKIRDIKKSIVNYNDWLKREMEKSEKKLNKKDIDLGILYSKIIDMANNVGGSDDFLKFIKENCK
jgi:hypothetical protein